MEDKKTFTYEFTQEELSAIEDAIVWKMIECKKWIEDCKDLKNDLERMIYESDSKTLRILEEIRNRLYFI